MLDLIRDISTSPATVDSKSRNPFAPKTENLTKYGNMYVNRGMKFSIDPKTGQLKVCYEVMATGSRIRTKVERTICTIKDGKCQ